MLRIRELREAHDPPLSQEKLARLADVSNDVIRRAERGFGVQTSNLQKIARALGVEIGDLFAVDGKKRKASA